MTTKPVIPPPVVRTPPGPEAALPLEIRPLQREERAWVEQRVSTIFGGNVVVSGGVAYEPGRLPGRVAVRGDERVGLVTWHVQGRECQMISIDAVYPGQGIGSAMVEEVEQVAQRLGCKRVWLLLTNDNLDAMRFYMRRGYRMVAVHRDAVEDIRRFKPDYPEVGYHGIPLHDYVELEKRFSRAGWPRSTE